MSGYERELREILAGNRDVIERITRSCTAEERANYLKIIENPFITVRAAGSLGIADLVAMRGDISFIVEIRCERSPPSCSAMKEAGCSAWQRTCTDGASSQGYCPSLPSE
ncbi:MAG: hypothetical protein DRN21_04950 [Thermoplasmata archaeon]|nr:MAG: hypothetical protein DRN21_04950 [Thermoplasmata archaeon]